MLQRPAAAQPRPHTSVTLATVVSACSATARDIVEIRHVGSQSQPMHILSFIKLNKCSRSLKKYEVLPFLYLWDYTI